MRKIVGKLFGALAVNRLAQSRRAAGKKKENWQYTLHVNPLLYRRFNNRPCHW
jgi:hypothetical protein